MINKELVVKKNISLFEALQIMDNIRHKLLIICEEQKFLGIITIGDIQRAFLRKEEMSNPVEKYIRSDIIYADTQMEINEIKNIMQQIRIECMPVVDGNGFLVDTISWEELFSSTCSNVGEKLGYPVVIMAGGQGTRLLPLTNIIPKPLVPISERTIIEEIMDKFVAVGCNNFYISVNYKADTIKNFFKDKDKYDVQFIQEDKPLGTAGALYLLKDDLEGTFFVSNCDILADVNFVDLVNYHKENANVLTVVSVLKNYSIPYGTLETKENGILTSLKEKPELVYQINSGVYLLESQIFDFICDGEFIHITDLIQRLLNAGKRIGVFPISDGSWSDMGNWEEYLKLIKSV